MLRFSSSTLGIACLAMAACGGGGGGGSGNAGQTTDTGVHVDAATGDDATGDGSSARPFRSITRGMLAADFGETVYVGPGTYDAAHGEFFPILPPLGATIVGTEHLNPFGGTTRLTHVVGGGYWSGDPDHRLHATIVPNNDNHVSGMTFENPEPFVVGGAKPAAIVLSHPRVRLDSCSFQNSDKGMRLVGGAHDTYTTNCAFFGSLVGVYVEGASGANRFEDCYVASNNVGVMCFSTGADFGGDITASMGGNVFTANEQNDFVHAAGEGVTLYAAYCFWDHAPPTYSGAGGPKDPTSDIWIADLAANVVSGSYQLYDASNPPPAHP